MANKPTILIVGASRGLGLALVEQFRGRNWHVIATVRGTSPGLDALKARFPASLEEETTNIADEASVRALRQRLDGRTIDMRFVNAGAQRVGIVHPRRRAAPLPGHKPSFDRTQRDCHLRRARAGRQPDRHRGRGGAAGRLLGAGRSAKAEAMLAEWGM
jgi:NAD(P)-dependent dehydrogenase (short-subunit alcohol dehydrogenase family)